MTEQPRRRKHRRVVRPATGGESGPEPRADEPAKEDPTPRDRARETWLNEQRPPHWQ
ncbi:hypothetical protein FB459_0970 [Yimella lutea]|uniref:Uncharacterized protein n=1 Tax=Yimella lutea TaxID=587872 RepID=A0A542EE55_9MICO|nr:hypothetical protein [Yimella lutea]TQJ13546.1 hypothetical protein FB459_0970 [Yimella lutea]